MQLSDTVKQLGNWLGDTIARDKGQAWLDKIEQIRLQGKAIEAGDEEVTEALAQELAASSDEDLLLVARAFSHFLNLANIAEQAYSVTPDGLANQAYPDPWGDLRKLFAAGKFDAEKLRTAIEQLQIDLVLTAHPTEVTRHTLIQKQREIADNLGHKPRDDRRLVELIAQAWHTSSIRAQRPTPVDEASWGLSVIEHSFWEALPEFLRQLDQLMQEFCGETLAPTFTPLTISSWMGGDRDGNPNVTAKVTADVLVMSRYRAAELYLQDIDQLISELSMEASCASAELIDIAGDNDHPYRAVLRPLQKQLRATRDLMRARHKGLDEPLLGNIINSSEQLLAPLELCYRSLEERGLEVIARGRLLDTIRRVRAFGIGLIRLDLRQHSERHNDVLAEITQYLDIKDSTGDSDYRNWSEADRQQFLLEELASRRPLIPSDLPASVEVREVLDTLCVAAQQPRELLGIYIISMAAKPSDVLLVKLLLQQAEIIDLPVAPLFETLDDLDGAPQAMEALLQQRWYREHIADHQYVMIGYSDSAKDAGVLAAAWAQYRAQDALIKLHKKYGVKLTLFHGRGGTIGRGGAPAHTAILSQPPGSVDGGLRVTEQGETIRYKFGMPDLATRSLALYGSAVLEALLVPPPEPEQQWCQVMDEMAQVSCEAYRAVVCGEPDFVRYFRQATPEQELAQLPLGSRPAKRKLDGGIESLRAIPWIFSWAQNRLVLPSSLGFGAALKQALESGRRDLLVEMREQWPFFRARIDMMEMVYSKASSRVAALYDKKLVEPSLQPLGQKLHAQLDSDIQTLLDFQGQEKLLERDPWARRSFNVRKPYLMPLHLLQVEMLSRTRQGDATLSEEQKSIRLRAQMVIVSGIAAGLRNTG